MDDLTERLNAGIALRDCGDHEAAEKIFLACQAEHEAAFGMPDPMISKSLVIPRFRQQRWEEAVALALRAIAVLEETAGPQDDDHKEQIAMIGDWKFQAEWLLHRHEDALGTARVVLAHMKAVHLEEHFKFHTIQQQMALLQTQVPVKWDAGKQLIVPDVPMQRSPEPRRARPALVRNAGVAATAPDPVPPQQLMRRMLYAFQKSDPKGHGMPVELRVSRDARLGEVHHLQIATPYAACHPKCPKGLSGFVEHGVRWGLDAKQLGA